MANDWMQALSNPLGIVVKKYMFDVLQERYLKHEDIIERVSHSLATRCDVEKFGKLILEVYEAGFMKAVNDNKEAWERLGYKPTIKQSPTPNAQQPQTIFKNTSQKNQD
jgi:hypothetical protein